MRATLTLPPTASQTIPADVLAALLAIDDAPVDVRTLPPARPVVSSTAPYVAPPILAARVLRADDPRRTLHPIDARGL